MMTDRFKAFARMTLVAVGSAAAFWLVRDHWGHLSGYLIYLPYAFFLACPLMHLFMHHGHGHGDHAHDHRQGGPNPPPA